MKKSEKTLHSFMVAEPTTGGPGYSVTLEPEAASSLFNLVDSEYSGDVCVQLFKLTIHIAGLQTALLEATENEFDNKANFRVDPIMPDVFWTIDELYTFFNGLEIKFTNPEQRERS